MTSDRREAFLSGQRPEDVHVYLHDSVLSNPEALTEHGERVPDGLVLVLDGEQARPLFQRATGIDPMALASEAMDTDGEIDPSCTGGVCPAGADHRADLVFAFAEEQNDEVGGLYAEGPVIHAYVSCDCGERYSDRWLADAE